MNTNNFNQSSTGLNVELSVFRDSLEGQDLFHENFETIEQSPSDRITRLFYTEFGHDDEPNSLSDCYDFTDCTFRDFRAYCLEYGTGAVADLIEYKFSTYKTWKEYAEDVLSEIGIGEAMRDGFPAIHGAEELYEVTTAKGYSQGDYSEILYKSSEGFEPKNLFKNLIFNLPIFARLDIDDVEYFLTEGLRDGYEWRIGEVLTYCRETLKLSGDVLEWLDENLPEYPTCD